MLFRSAWSQACHLPAHREGDRVEDSHPGVLSQGLEVTHISSTLRPLDKDLVTCLHLLQGRLGSVVYLSSHVPSQISVPLGEEENDHREWIISGNCRDAELSLGQNEIMFMEQLAHPWHEVETWKW